MNFWDIVIETFNPRKFKPQLKGGPMKDGFQKPAFRIPTIHDLLMSIDFVPPMYAPPTGISKLVVLEDNDATIKMVIKGRSPAMRHIQRTHRQRTDPCPADAVQTRSRGVFR